MIFEEFLQKNIRRIFCIVLEVAYNNMKLLFLCKYILFDLVHGFLMIDDGDFLIHQLERLDYFLL